jgi:hypothetical protein
MWEEIKHFIHFSDNTTFIPAAQNGLDILHKIRPLTEKVYGRLLLVPKEDIFCSGLTNWFDKI